MSRSVSQAAKAAGDRDEMGADRPVDLVHLAHFTMGDRALEREVLNLFRKQSALYLERLRAAPNEAVWCEAAHTLKGSARGIGAWAVADAASQLETLRGPMKSRRVSGGVHMLAERIYQANSFIHEILAKS